MSELASVQTLLAAYRALPLQAMEDLIEDGKAAQDRGYFSPVEDCLLYTSPSPRD